MTEETQRDRLMMQYGMLAESSEDEETDPPPLRNIKDCQLTQTVHTQKELTQKRETLTSKSILGTKLEKIFTHIHF